MNLLKFNYLLWKQWVTEYKKRRIDKHMLKMYYLKVDEAIAKFKAHPRKYYIVQKSISEWEILGSQEIRKMRKFSVAKKDENFMKLHETAPYISPENVDRWVHEQTRRKNKWWFLFTENYYKPVTREELNMLKEVSTYLPSGYRVCEKLDNFINKHS